MEYVTVRELGRLQRSGVLAVYLVRAPIPRSPKDTMTPSDTLGQLLSSAYDGAVAPEHLADLRRSKNREKPSGDQLT
jgi:hypothetical protein